MPAVLNKEQAEAVTYGEGQLLLLAGPGSGKTFVITQRIYTLIQKYHVNPAQIAVLTFTKAAAAEMKKRFQIQNTYNVQPFFGTFHSFFYYILRETYPKQKLTILSGKEKQNYIREILTFQGGSVSQETIENQISEIDRFAMQGQTPDRYQTAYTEKEEFIPLYHAYQERKRQEQKLDFEDITEQCCKMFYDGEEVCGKWQKRFRYFLIDEFQDIDTKQYQIIKRLAGAKGQLFLVGDDDQAIYGFRGAKPDIMRQAGQDYPHLKTLFLSRNYRSSRQIVCAAGMVIRENQNRFEKKPMEAEKEGENVRLLCFQTKEAELTFWKQYFSGVAKQGKLSEYAVIFRTNGQLEAFAAELEKEKIPISRKKRDKGIYESKVCLDLMAYIDFAKGDRSRANFYRFMNKPYRGYKREDIRQERIQEGVLSKLLEEDLARIAAMKPYAAIQYVRKKMGYDRWLAEHDGMNIAEKLQESMREIGDWETWKQRMERETEEGASGDLTEACITLVTVHGAKGLEYERVCIPMVNEGNMPHRKNGTEAGIEEERRLLYVAMTRAEKSLLIGYEEKAASGFLKPLQSH